MQKFSTQLKAADLISITGAGLMGLGIGASISDKLTGALPVLIVLGIVLHALGMYGKFQIERMHIQPPNWVLVIFGLCWVGLMLSALYLLIARYTVIL